MDILHKLIYSDINYRAIVSHYYHDYQSFIHNFAEFFYFSSDVAVFKQEF